ncbi:MAG: hypothetical protein N4J56_005781 [Chroococcidiopsis sp. SAG 2025]|uniref:hypothetical protein n=1 Tax=Chroococcidiopsis sp. SAG 2025 TaxID=171389 RepID=UPI002936DA1F|nr:hypothetical protein [Chroococcidiopsis sp. SAG 2025]MDV2996127.1 hypothetical protein [Chroococcidiopsis sp. SAG 2025]
MRDKSSLASDVRYEFFGDRDSHSDDKKIEKTITLTKCGAYRITNPTTEFCGGMRSRDSLRIKDSYDEATDSKYR